MPGRGVFGENDDVSITDRLRDWAKAAVRPSGPPPRPTRRNQIFDVAVALVLAVFAIRYATSGQDVPMLVVEDGPAVGPSVPSLPPGLDSDSRNDAAIAATLSAIALVFRRRFPLTALWIVLGLTVLVASSDPRLTFYACVIAAYSAAAYSQYRVPALVSAGLVVVAISVGADAGIPAVPTQYVPLLVLVPIIVAADGLRRWKLRAENLKRSRAEAVRRATEDERARIARDLHDVVTHNVSVMVIQAGAARKVMNTSPDQASEALLAVEAGGRSAMAELRQVMGLLSRDGTNGDTGADSDLSPAPGLDRLESLVAGVCDAGLPTTLSVSGGVRPLAPGIELAAYRVVQEALTNAMKHASGAVATVTVEYGATRLRVEIVDTGGESSDTETGSGRGLAGLNERIDVYGGTLQAGRRLTGGYRVEAVIPVEEP